MGQPPTCGQGLAENARLPARIGELMAAMTAVLETHVRALDLGDENGRRERDAYLSLAGALQRVAGALQTTATEMDGYRTMPMARHDPAAMTGPEPRQALAAFVRAGKALLALLAETVARDEKLLAGM
jgi:hypothetical protein